MPHKCIGCGRIFDKNDEAILVGCPECGANRFLFIREGEIPGDRDQPDIDQIKEDEASAKVEEIIDRIEKTIEDDSIFTRLESVRILEPGTYEVNLESLLERDEIILALKEDGSYVIHLPSIFARFKGGGKRR
ncbi:MAG: hypothetical protein CW694_06685 [Candidatus Syntrophoarchaeum sp. WYZ-LMO15]|nr:MAG: hypothetical protein CW694_06685 [Candidatus Syntrophoarchaeum sp. WYZ-LMO15]